ncbi:uncharacterized protein LOC123557240 [Mercenaria mercenaria]|uniref:uncharacterized protein LOC123557240 n=1 Tax=Mercenaria mercenaria TaxID=6596 RepID=UPI00234F3FDC|nr:uncharacterized protein LOC123557240 [Mercenaria mercenaria]XP_053400851.1 uncharacterized protein LOC123557240 [Mercenaria mercenaria]
MSERAENKYAIIKEVLKKAGKKVSQKEIEDAISRYNDMVKELEHFKNLSIKQDQQSGHSKQIEKLQDENKILREETNNMKKQIEELRHRFSTLAGQKMINGNPDIADLSDPFRPTNLAEKFHQLYDDEWTPAFEFLDKTPSMDESKVIDFLANIVKEIDKVCSKTSENQISKIKQYITDDLVSPKVETKEGTMVATKRSAVDEKQEKLVSNLLAEFRKSFGMLSVQPLVELFDKYYMVKMRKPWNIPSSAKELNYFVAKCLEIVWLMKIQHPPMKFLWLYEGEKCDKDRFSFFTKRGEKVKQTVWPAVLLHSEGPLVAKGVIQAI